MPVFMDRHELAGMTPADVAKAHQMDLEVQGKYDACFMTYWFDAGRGTAFCLVEAADAETALRIHQESHGAVPTTIIPVDLAAVQAFLGRLEDPRGVGSQPICERALRAVMFTDLVNSTEMTGRLGDHLAVELVRAHDHFVRAALSDHGGTEVKHTGDGIMAAFGECEQALEGCCAIMKAIDTFNRGRDEPLYLRIGVHVGEPVQDSHDLFGATVQLAARICADAAVESVVISEDVRVLLNDRFALTALGRRVLKGFREPVPLYSVDWRASGGPKVRQADALG
jgi:class 3 adenylate cyclase